jgi:hypothetical protein
MRVGCCFWFPDAGGPLDTVHLTALESDEWVGLAAWSQVRSAELPALAGLLSTPLPARVSPAGVPALAAECARVDWETLAGLALGGFAAVSLVVSQAAGQAAAGLQFAGDAESGAEDATT